MYWVKLRSGGGGNLGSTYVGRWRKNQVTMAVAAKLGETFLLLLDDRQLAVGGVRWRRRRSGSG